MSFLLLDDDKTPSEGMASRSAGRGTPRRSPRISGRSETPETRHHVISTTTSRRPLSPELIEQMTPPAASYRARRPFPNLQSLASDSASIGVKQEDASTSFYVREPSQQSRMTSPLPYQSSLLRGDQRSFKEPRDVNNSLSASLSVLSGSSGLTEDYEQEEREVARLEINEQQRNGRPAGGLRRTSGQRKGRTSLDNQAYRPGSGDEEDDDNIRSPTRRRKKGRNSNSLTAYDQGRIDNARWMNATTKKGRRRRTGTSVQAGEEGYEDEEGYDTSMIDQGDDDAGATSGKETRFDEASDSDNDDGDNLTTAAPHDKSGSQPRKAQGRSEAFKLLSSLASFTMSCVVTILTWLMKIPKLAWGTFGRSVSSHLLRAILTAIFVGAVSYTYSSLGGISGMVARLPSLASTYPYSLSDDVPDTPSISFALDRENQRLRAELKRLSARLDTISSSIDSQITTSLSSAAAKIQAEADARQSSEVSRLTASTKRTISRLAQDELKSIQDSVSSSVELMLRDLDNKINTQLKKRADDTEDKFFSKLEKEVGKIARYANNEVNARLGQAFDQTFLSELIEEKLERYSRDRTGKVDWAAVTSGAWVAEEGTVHRGYRYNSVWNVGKFLAQGRRVPIGDPVKAITPEAGLGPQNCWMTGWNSMLQVNLAEPKVVDEVVVEHPLPGMARTAPRRIIVWGLVDESDRQYYQSYRRAKASSQEEYLKQLLPEPLFSAVPQEYQHDAPLVLAAFEFKANGSTLQTFNLTEEAQVYPFGVEKVRWQFVDGWARNPPICVHRVRVHGSDWPVFGDKQQD